MTTLRSEVGPFKAVGEHCLKTPARRLTPKSDFLLKLEQKQRRRTRRAPGGSRA
jgi:hypothetical protein